MNENDGFAIEPVSLPVPFSIYIDRDACQSAATCLAYGFYELDDEAKAILLTSNGSNSDTPDNPMLNNDGSIDISELLNTTGCSIEELRQMALESAQACPFNAVIIRDSEGLQIWPEA